MVAALIMMNSINSILLFFTSHSGDNVVDKIPQDIVDLTLVIM